MWSSALTMVVLGMCTVTARGAAMLFGNESVVIAPYNMMAQLTDIVGSLCKAMPELMGCSVLNETLSQEAQQERSDVPESELLVFQHLLPLALQSYVAVEQRNRELMEKDTFQTAQLTVLLQEKARLEGILSSLEGQSVYARPTRDTQISVLPLVEEPTTDLETQKTLHLDQHTIVAKQLRPVDCSDHLLLGHTVSGVYEIYPFRCRCSRPVKVWCDMETDGGGWTVFLSRKNITPRENFNRTWNEYREGFGNVTGEYWLGNEMLFTMTNSRLYTLRMSFRLTDGNDKWGEWASFKVLNEKNKYKLEVPTYNGLSMIDHCFSLHNNRFFSTFDYDNDGNTGKNCAMDLMGGWWYNNCGTLEATRPFTSGGELYTTCPYKVHNKKIPLKGTSLQMMLRPHICNKQVKSVYFNGYDCREHND